MVDEKKNTDRKKALESAILQIEKQFGKGAIMKYGEGAAVKKYRSHTHGLPCAGYCIGNRRNTQRQDYRNLRVPNLRVKPLFLFISLQNCKSKAE